jgi:hypothetical protein
VAARETIVRRRLRGNTEKILLRLRKRIVVSGRIHRRGYGIRHPYNDVKNDV